MPPALEQKALQQALKLGSHGLAKFPIYHILQFYGFSLNCESWHCCKSTTMLQQTLYWDSHFLLKMQKLLPSDVFSILCFHSSIIPYRTCTDMYISYDKNNLYMFVTQSVSLYQLQPHSAIVLDIRISTCST